MELVVKLNGGLANRMRVLGACMALKSQSNCRIRVIWEQNNALNCAYDDLFEKSNTLELEEWPYLKPLKLVSKARRKKTLRKLKERSCVYLTDTDIRALDKPYGLLSLLQEGKTIFIDTCERFFGNPEDIRLVKPRVEIIKKVAERNCTGYYGFHVRRGDHDLSKERSPLELFKVALHQHKHEKCYLCTDDMDVAKELKEEFPDLIHFSHELSRQLPAAIQWALVDFLMLSASKKIYGSFWSSFSIEAASYGGAPLEIVQKESGYPRVATP